MSSLIRRLEIRILKARKYVRQEWRIDPQTDMPVRLPKGTGNIIRNDHTNTGSRHWPRPTGRPKGYDRDGRKVRAA